METISIVLLILLGILASLFAGLTYIGLAEKSKSMFITCGIVTSALITVWCLVLFTSPRFGDIRVFCKTELTRITRHVKGIPYTSAEFICTEKQILEVYTPTSEGSGTGVWREVK